MSLYGVCPHESQFILRISRTTGVCPSESEGVGEGLTFSPVRNGTRRLASKAEIRPLHHRGHHRIHNDHACLVEYVPTPHRWNILNHIPNSVSGVEWHMPGILLPMPDVKKIL